MEGYAQVGVAVIVAVIFGIIGMQVAVEADYNSVYTLDNNTEWNTGTLTGVQVSNGEVLLASGNTTGTYTSTTISNETNRIEVYATVPDPDNSSVSLSVGGNTYDLVDGRNAFKLDSSVTSYTFDLSFDRDSTSVTSPAVQRYEAQFGEDGLLTLIATAAFALLLLLSALKLRHRMRNGGMGM